MKPICSLESDGIRVQFDDRDGMPWVQLIDLVSQTTWGPTPAIGIEMYDVACQRVDAVAPSRVETKHRGDAVELEAIHEWYGIKFVVRFTIDRGELVVMIPTNRIVHSIAEMEMLAGVHVLPELLEVDSRKPGHLVLPIQNGAILYPQRHQQLQDAFLIYGQQHRWEDMPMLPCCGAVREQSKAALLAIAASGECDAECKVDLDGHGRGRTGFSMRYLYTPIDTVDPIDRVVRYAPLRGKDAGYSGMGRRMFQHVGEISGRKTLAQRAAENPKLEYAATAYTLKIFHAHKQIDSIDGSGEYNVWTTFDQAAEQLSFVKRHGIDRVWVQNVGWNPEGHDGMWPTRFPVNPECGGEEAFRRMIAHGKSLGFQMCVHDNYTDRYKRSPRFNPDHCIGSIYNRPLRRGRWSGGINHLTWGLALPDSELRDQLLAMKKLGIDGVYYIDAMGNPLELSYNPKHGDRRYRRACAEGIVRIQKTADELFGGNAIEAAYLYCAAQTDSMATPWYPHLLTPRKELVDHHVPLWCMALKGHLFYESDVLMSSVVDQPHYKHRTMALRLLEMAEVGMKPRTETCYVSAKWACYPVEASIEAMKLDYDLMLRKLRSTCLEPLLDHELVGGDPREGNHVTRSRYGDGTEVLCDFGRPRMEINGEPYPLPVNFKKNPPIPIGERPPGVLVSIGAGGDEK